MVAIARITISDTDTPTPYIDPTTGEWMVYDATKRAYVSTGIRAQGKDGKDVDPTQLKELQDGLTSAKTSISALQTAKEEIEKGKLSISDLPKNLKWIYDAFHNGETEIEGGLILSKYIGLSNSSDKVTSYISGEDGAGAHMLAAGVTSLSDQDAVSYVNYDGSAKFGQMEISKEGLVHIRADRQAEVSLEAWHHDGGFDVAERRKGVLGAVWVGTVSFDDNQDLILERHDMLTSGARIKLTRDGVHINRFDDRVMPRVLAHGKFKKTGERLFVRSYGKYTTSNFSCLRVAEGKYKLTFPAEWINQYTLAFQGTEQDSQRGQSARFVSFGEPWIVGETGSVHVFGADDNSLEDVAVYFQIIAI